MLKTLARRWRFLFGAALIIGLFVSAVASSYEFRACVETDQNQNAAQNQKGSGVVTSSFQWADLRYNCLGFWFNGNKDSLSALSAILLTIITFGLVWTAVRQEHTTRAQLRAYVSARPDFITSFDETHWANGQFTIANVGPTPAFKMRHRSKISALPADLPRNFELPPLDSDFTAPLVVFPTSMVAGNTPNNLFTAAELGGIRSKALKIYVYGIVEYQDTFGRNRWTTFCSSADPTDEVLAKLAANSTELFSNMRYKIAPIGNDAC